MIYNFFLSSQFFSMFRINYVRNQCQSAWNNVFFCSVSWSVRRLVFINIDQNPKVIDTLCFLFSFLRYFSAFGIFEIWNHEMLKSKNNNVGRTCWFVYLYALFSFSLFFPHIHTYIFFMSLDHQTCLIIDIKQNNYFIAIKTRNLHKDLRSWWSYFKFTSFQM